MTSKLVRSRRATLAIAARRLGSRSCSRIRLSSSVVSCALTSDRAIASVRRANSLPRVKMQKWCRMAAASALRPVPSVAIVSIILGIQSLLSCSLSSIIWRRSATSSLEPARSVLFTIRMSPTSRIPALSDCTESPIPGTWTRIVV